MAIASFPVTEMLVGTNIEVGESVVAALLNDRLRNPKLLGPPHHLTRMPPEWALFKAAGRLNSKAELVSGVGLAGSEALYLANFERPLHPLGCRQSHVWLRAGETLEAELWAMAQRGPLRLEVGIRPEQAGAPAYATAELEVAAPYWRRYDAVLQAPEDDEGAEFYVRIVGTGAVWIDQMHLRAAGPLVREETVALVAQLRPGAIRFPGGCISTLYRWQFGVGPVERRPPAHEPIFVGRLNYDFGTDEFLELCERVGAVPHLTVALGSGTPEDAANWAAHCREWYERRGGEPPPLYWHVGAEHWGHWEIGYTTAEQYAAVLREWAPAIRAAYPNARIVALGQATSHDVGSGLAGEGKPWRSIVVAEALDHFDVLALQLYSIMEPSWPRDPSALLAKVREDAHAAVAEVAAAVEEARSLPTPKTVALSEWNLWTSASSHRRYVEPADGLHVLFLAEVLNGLAPLMPTLELVEHYSLLNWFGVLQVEGASMQATPAAALLRWYREAVPAAVASAPLEHEDPDLSVLALAGAEVTTLFVVNWGPRTRVRLGCAGRLVQSIAAAAPEDPAVVGEQEPAREWIELPGLSVTRVLLEERA